MGNGFPIGGILIAPHILPKYGLLGTTFGGNHLACAAALAVLEVMETENLMQAARENGDYLLEALRTIKDLDGVRGIGLMIGFDIPDKLKETRRQLLSEHHIFTGEAKPNVIRLLPALSVSRKQIDEFLVALKATLKKLGQVPEVQPSSASKV